MKRMQNRGSNEKYELSRDTFDHKCGLLHRLGSLMDHRNITLFYWSLKAFSRMRPKTGHIHSARGLEVTDWIDNQAVYETIVSRDRKSVV